MAQNILQLKMLKMIIEAYSSHYILCKNQDILGKISAKAAESDFNLSNSSNRNTAHSTQQKYVRVFFYYFFYL